MELTGEAILKEIVKSHTKIIGQLVEDVYALQKKVNELEERNGNK